MTEYAIFDPSSGQRVSPASGPAAHSQVGGSFKDLQYGEWNPPADLVSCDPHDHPGYGDEATVGPVPDNIIGGELRACDHDWCDVDGGPDDTDGDEGDSIDVDQLDGDDDPADCPDLDCGDGADGPDGVDAEPAANIVVDERAQALRNMFGPGPMSRSRL